MRAIPKPKLDEVADRLRSAGIEPELIEALLDPHRRRMRVEAKRISLAQTVNDLERLAQYEVASLARHICEELLRLGHLTVTQRRDGDDTTIRVSLDYLIGEPTGE
jgi:hypothetical protein